MLTEKVRRTNFYDGDDPFDLRNPLRPEGDALGWAARQAADDLDLTRQDDSSNAESLRRMAQYLMREFGYSEEDEELIKTLRQIGYNVPRQEWEEIQETLCVVRLAGLLR